MKTFWGLNPSFCSWALGRLPLFADPIRRGVAFEVFKEDGTPTAELSPLGPDGWPIEDGRWHGVRIFGDMGGTLPELKTNFDSVHLRINPGEAAFFSWKHKNHAFLERLKPSIGWWHIPSLEALNYFNPVCLRTLDWGYQARKEKRPDWTKPRVKPEDPLQGSEMAVELQADAANKLGAALWWNAPPRFELTVQEYEARLEVYLVAIRDTVKKPPILEYGNELWNVGFPVADWLHGVAASYDAPTSWTVLAAHEISILKRVADRVFGEPGPLGHRPYYLFVGGHIGNPGTLNRILSALYFTPDMAGPAIYMQPLKADQEKWATSSGMTIPQDWLQASAMNNMQQFRVKLDAHRNILKVHNVPYFACYEVGNDMHAKGDAYKRAALQAQREEWMGDAYRAVRKMLNDAGVNLACLYSAASSQSLERSFGLLESCDLTKTMPKARAARGD